ncbi:hypothetical protein ACLI4Y_00610 [Natrialbaceae archaeon A-CW3]
MAGDTDTETEQYFGYPRQTVVLEAIRISYAMGISGAVTVVIALGWYWLDPGVSPGAESTIGVLLLFIFPTAFALGLYTYDRRHRRDLVIADAVVRVVRPIAALIRLLRGVS